MSTAECYIIHNVTCVLLVEAYACVNTHILTSRRVGNVQYRWTQTWEAIYGFNVLNTPPIKYVQRVDRTNGLGLKLKQNCFTRSDCVQNYNIQFACKCKKTQCVNKKHLHLNRITELTWYLFAYWMQIETMVLSSSLSLSATKAESKVNKLFLNIKVSTRSIYEGANTFSNWILQYLVAYDIIELYRWLMCMKFRPSSNTIIDRAVLKLEGLRDSTAYIQWFQLQSSDDSKVDYFNSLF